MTADLIFDVDPQHTCRAIGSPAGGDLYRLAADRTAWEHVRAVAGLDLASWTPHARDDAEVRRLKRLPVPAGVA